MKRNPRHTTAVAAAAILALAAAAPARAQQAGWLSQPQTEAGMVGDLLATFAQMALDGYGEPAPGQLLRSRVLIDLALEQIDSDPHLWQFRGELARLDGDEPLQLQAIRRYAQLRPSDDHVQLQLILHRVQQEQTVEARIDLIERLLGSESAKAFSTPLRSRLASFAAASALEVGDRARYARWLKEALRLDDANPQAAMMTYEHTVEHTQDPLRVGSALIHLIRADPANPQARLALARLLAAELAWDQAVRQLEMTAQLARAPLSMEDWQLYVIAQAAAGRADAALKSIELAVRLHEQAEAARLAGNAPPPDDPRAATWALMSIELVRLAILHGTNQPDAAAASLARFEQLGAAADRASMLPLMIVAYGGDAARVEPLFGDESLPPEERTRLEGWVALRRGDHERATRLLAPLAEHDGAAALGAALAEQDATRRRMMLRDTAARWHGTPLGLTAMMQLSRAGDPSVVSDTGRALIELMARTPQRIWHTDMSVAPWVTMKLDVRPVRVSYLEPIELEISLRNVSGAPLSVGPRGGVSSRLWISIEPRFGGRSLGPQPPIVVDLGRRLRLDANEVLTHRVRLDRGGFGYLRLANPSTTLNWRLGGTLDPYTNDYGVIEIGPIGNRVMVGPLTSLGSPVTSENIDLWLNDLESDDAATRYRAVGRLLGALQNPPDKDNVRAATAARKRIGDAVNERYARSSRLDRAWIVGLLGFAGEHRDVLQRVTDDAERSDDVLVRLLYLVNAADGPESPVLLSAMRHTNPVIRDFAAAMQEAIRAAEAAAAERARKEAEWRAQRGLSPTDAEGQPVEGEAEGEGLVPMEGMEVLPESDALTPTPPVMELDAPRMED